MLVRVGSHLVNVAKVAAVIDTGSPNDLVVILTDGLEPIHLRGDDAERARNQLEEVRLASLER